MVNEWFVYFSLLVVNGGSRDKFMMIKDGKGMTVNERLIGYIMVND